MKRRIKSKKLNWLVWQQLQQHRPPWRYWFIFFRNIFTTADATNDSFEQKYEIVSYYSDNSTCTPKPYCSDNMNILLSQYFFQESFSIIMLLIGLSPRFNDFKIQLLNISDISSEYLNLRFRSRIFIIGKMLNGLLF